MKKALNITIIIVLTLILGSCNENDTSNLNRDFVINEINFYMQNNDSIELMFDTGLDDVEEEIEYGKADFFNYNLKNTSNVDIEYELYYLAFSNLLFIKQIVEKIEELSYGVCYENIVSTEKLCIDYKNDILVLRYYENIVDLDTIISHIYEFSRVEDKVIMKKYSTIYDTEKLETILHQKIVVDEYNSFLKEEFYPLTDSFVYEYTNYLEQEYFMYKGVMDAEKEFVRQTVEFYIPSFNAYVSYDIKEDLLEDYRIKIFKDGHRVLKVDVNIKDNNPTVNELTWNLLSIDGWNSIDVIAKTHYIYQGSFQTMEDYIISVQLNGYGKVVAYKMFEGDLIDSDITLKEYGLTSGYTLQNIENTRLFFESNYITELFDYGFINNDPNNRLIIKSSVEVDNQELEVFIDKF